MHRTPECSPEANSSLSGRVYEAERLICLNIKSFIADLCYVDRAFLIGNILGGDHYAINDIIDSSSEMFFKPGTLRYAFSSRLDARAGRGPAISLDMHFTHRLIHVPFLLCLESSFAGVSLTGENARIVHSEATLGQLLDAFGDARIHDALESQHNNPAQNPVMRTGNNFCH